MPMHVNLRSKDHRRRIAQAAPAAWNLHFVGTDAAVVNCGHGATLNNLHASAFTVDFWARPETMAPGGVRAIIDKGDADGAGWIVFQYSGGLRGRIRANTDQAVTYVGFVDLPIDWYHIALTFDPDGDKKPRLWVNGVLAAGGSAVVLPVDDDSAKDLLFGVDGGGHDWTGDLGWVRLSNTIRYTDTFDPPSRFTPPDLDANTIELWPVNEGQGTTIAATVSSPTNDGTFSSTSGIPDWQYN
jgi:hypothetical protein